MTIDWSKAPDWAQFVAQDADGSWHWYQDAPDNAFFEDQRAVDTGRYQRLGAEPVATWKVTLQRRPDPELIEETRAAVAATPEAAPVVLPPPDLWRDAEGLRGYAADPGNGPWYTAETVRALLAGVSAAVEIDGWKWMTHPDYRSGKPIPVLLFVEDGVTYYRPFDDDATDFEWDVRSSEWKEITAPQAQADARDAEIESAVLAERERICAAIKAEDDHCVTQGDYMLDSDDCIKVARGEWERPVYDAAIAAAKGE